MKYFTSDLWNKINSLIEEERAAADKQWVENGKEYCKIFEEIKESLPKKFLKLYFKLGFHDFKLCDIKINNKEESNNKKPVTVDIILTDEDKKWDIKYIGVKRILIDYLPEFTENDPYSETVGFDDFGYDEFSRVDKNILAHEILFASGATILIHFTKISINPVVE
ncbi:MAG: hypothetical protein WC677_08690 [Clostridia bacterium]|jgi:hypothetical protein